MRLAACIDGVGMLGPGIADWESAAALLRGATAYAPQPTVLPLPAVLPAAERRRTGRVVKLTIALALEATARAGIDPRSLPAVFTSSGGDGHNCHELCAALATTAREISPTRFSNSVHNASAGYWSIATGAMTASNALCAYDASFGAGLLEAVTQVVVERSSLLFVAYDTDYPPPLRAKRPLPDAFGIALVLAPAPGPHTLAHIELDLTDDPADGLADPGLEALRMAIPAARGLPMLSLVAQERSGRAVLAYMDDLRVAVEVRTCA
jgi:hypothetical protein